MIRVMTQATLQELDPERRRYVVMFYMMSIYLKPHQKTNYHYFLEHLLQILNSKI